ncbi:PRAME family member 12-like [Urocitellus parryii]
MRKPQLEMIRVALDGLDMLLAQQDRPRRWKLQVLDFRNVHYNFWKMWSGAMVDACSSEAIKKNRKLKHGLAMAAKPPLKMRNLRKLLVSQVRVPAHTSPEEQERLLAQLTSQFLRLDCLRKFCVDAVLLLKGHLEQVLGHLKTPLKTLSVTNCRLSDSDWNYLSRFPNTRKLRHVELRGIKLTNFSPEPLKILLETVVATLKSLELESCRITDSQLQALLPVLSRCSQLRVLNFHGNHISMSALRDLLLHTATLSQLSRELYPAPLESYDAQGDIHPGRCSQLCAELTAIVRDFRQPKVLVFCAVPCPQCGSMFLYNKGLLQCCCPTAA